MDCGPASLKCVLEGFGIPVSYGRLRESCQTDVDGTSIDTVEEVAMQLGLDAEQIMLEATGECTGVSRLQQGKLTVWQTDRNPKTEQLELMILTVWIGIRRFLIYWLLEGTVVSSRYGT